MKNYIIEFLHTDGSIRKIKIEAINEDFAKGRFICNWGEEMKIINISEEAT